MPIRPVKTVLATEAEIAKICERAQEEIFAKVLAHYRKNPGNAWSGKYLVDLEKTVKALYRQLGVDIGAQFKQGLPQTMREFYDRAAAQLKTAGKRNAILGGPDTGRVNYFLNNSFEQIAMRTTRMSFDHIKQLRTISAEVLRTASITGATRQQVTKQLLDKAMQIPGFKFTDNGGRVWKEEAYFKMLARTELMNAGRTAYDEKCAAEGCDVMMLDYSGNCCDACAHYEGELFSLTGATPGLPTKADLEAAGVFHPNCTHSYSAVPDYVQKQDFTPEGKSRHNQARQQQEAKPESKTQPAEKPKATVPPPAMSHAEHVKHRQEQWQAAFEKRKADYAQRNSAAITTGLNEKAFINDANKRARLDADRLGLTGKARTAHIESFREDYLKEQRRNFESIAKKLESEYTPGMVKYGKPPKLVFDAKAPCSYQQGGEIHILTAGTPDFVKWCQADNCITHEFEHWVQSRAILKDPALIEKIRAAGDADWARIKDSYQKIGQLDKLKGNASVDMVSRYLYDTDYGSLSMEQRHCVICFTDSFGSLAGTRTYGMGHSSPGYYRDQNKRLIFGEAIANVKALQKYVARDKLTQIFPELDKIVTELEKK